MKEVTEKIAEEVKRQGIISFAEFMKLALYCPVYGYYEKEADTPGHDGDYYTSVSTGSLFGELLAFQFAAWLCPRGKHGSQPMQLVEAGAHQGQLARDILEWLRRFRPEILKNLEYWIIEPSPQRTAWQKRALNDFRANVRWAAGIPELAEALPAGVRGVIFSNELLDAMPVHRFGWDAVGQEWFEWGVALEDEQFKWRRMPFAESAFSGSVTASEQGSGPLLPWEMPADLLAVLPDNFSTEVGSDALAWWREAARVLSEGRLLTIDYGLPAESFYAPERAEGTLRGYFQHRLVTDVLARPGSQDITAEVNFTAIQRAGEDAGLKTETLASQSQFLTSIAASEETGVGEWTAKQLRQFQSLTHPEHLGRAFHVLIQSRGADACNS